MIQITYNPYYFGTNCKHHQILNTPGYLRWCEFNNIFISVQISRETTCLTPQNLICDGGGLNITDVNFCGHTGVPIVIFIIM